MSASTAFKISLVAFLLAITTSPARAQWAVIDPANLAQNILTAARTAQQIENQVRQLRNEARMLENEARNLERMDFNSLGRIRSTLARTERLFDDAEGLSLNLARLEQEFDALYPDRYNESVSRARLTSDSRRRWTNSREAFGTALAVQAQANANFSDDEEVLSDLIDRSQGAEGALQAAQATNQLLALHSRQMIQSQQLDIANTRATAAEHVRAIAAEERSRELRRRFMRTQTLYTPELVASVHD